MAKPLLSIGMIFKNEIRCLERCMESLAPLREAVSCELVMADTGSTDGSRKVAEKYADILFDFPWVNDFAAARNAVMEHCSGKWFMTIDADEWLDADFRQLLQFLQSGGNGIDAGALLVRNYRSYDEADQGEYTDAMPIRILRMDTGLRYEGAIHESWIITKQNKVAAMRRVILHHDGYVCMNTEEGDAKRVRNIQLLRKALEQEPDDLRRLQEFIESGSKEPDFLDIIRRAVSLVEQKHFKWDRHGSPIYRSAVFAAYERGLPELDEWIRRAEELFPDSFITRLDVEYVAFSRSVEKKNRADYARRGERWLIALEDYRAGRGDKVGMLYGGVDMATPNSESFVRIFTANAHLEEGNLERAWELLQVDGSNLDGKNTGSLVFVLQKFHANTNGDTSVLLRHFWEQINKPFPTETRAAERRKNFLENAAKAFHPAYLQAENRKGFLRHAYELYIPLAGQCELGTASAIMASTDCPEMEKLLSTVENWEDFPIFALQRAVLLGVRFPLLEKKLTLEEMDALISRMDGVQMAVQAANGDFKEDWQTLAWARGLALAAVQSCDWTDAEQGLALAGAFAKVERAFLPRYYAGELLCDENILVLPPMHRFGWYCAKAFDALDGGDAVGYVQMLKQALSVHPAMKPMVEFLTDHTPQLQAQKPSGELLALAEQVRTMLSAYAPEDPAVEALKASPAYQKVAHLIEGPELGFAGGLAQ